MQHAQKTKKNIFIQKSYFQRVMENIKKESKNKGENALNNEKAYVLLHPQQRRRSY